MNVASVLKAKGRAVATARPETTLKEIATQLSQKRIGAIIVVDDRDEIVGIISERDLVRAIATGDHKILESPVSDSMTRDVVLCGEERTIDELMEIMTKGRFRHLPVVEGGKLIGIVSIGDVVKNHIAEVEMEVSAMRDYLSTG